MKYLLLLIKHMNLNNLKEKINKIHNKTNKNKILIFIDMCLCAIIYGAGYNDYYYFEFYNLPHKKRKNYLTRTRNNKLVAKLNKKEKRNEFDQKNIFNQNYNDYLKRDWLYIDNNFDEFEQFIKKHKSFIAKPNDGSGGVGIKIITNYEDIKELYNYLIENRLLLLEELIVQNKYLNKINKSSVNTIRIITIKHKNKIYFVSSFLRIGNGCIVDNTCSGGMLSMIDIKTGKVLYPAVDLNDNIFYNHPISNIKINSIKIPYWRETLELVRKISLETTDLNYIAWDIAITNKEPIIVEGNPYPGYYYQFKIHMKNNTGYYKKIKNILKK